MRQLPNVPLGDPNLDDDSPVLAKLARLDRALDGLLTLSDELLRRTAWVRPDWWALGEEGSEAPAPVADEAAFVAKLAHLDLPAPVTLADDPHLGAALAALERGIADEGGTAARAHVVDDPGFVAMLERFDGMRPTPLANDPNLGAALAALERGIAAAAAGAGRSPLTGDAGFLARLEGFVEMPDATALADDPNLATALTALDRSMGDGVHPSDDPVFAAKLEQISDRVDSLELKSKTSTGRPSGQIHKFDKSKTTRV